MEWGDEWLAPDKLQHVLACLLIALAAAALAGRSSRPFLVDEAGFFGSSGASLRDAVADLLGVALAAALGSLVARLRRRRREKARDADASDGGGISMV